MKHPLPAQDHKTNVQNMLIVGLFAGCMIGFILSMLADAFRVGELKEVPPWLQSVFSGLATLVSVYAVYLVSQTLKATQDTLTATKDMAAQQAETNIAQTRAWLHVHQYKYQGNVEVSDEFGWDLEEQIWLQMMNYGNTPALDVSIVAMVNFYHFEGYEQESLSCEPFLSFKGVPFTKSAILPGKETSAIWVSFSSSEWPRSFDLALYIVQVKYLIMPSREEVSEVFTFKMHIHEEDVWLELQ
ncbi:QueT transporter family protein [Paracoccus tibetensis]|uniref:Uncharacterized protein n=1 Tax=Paracoccus tibetensis TaxID=336292 RepID=A0A1G5F6Q6_9RHOB|nr:QueT transporter family protein [Paracoccus tibetensis]SCY34939.1 hypothetical protein SAMN05660710_01277 [Paracoccus tibetensis]